MKPLSALRQEIIARRRAENEATRKKIAEAQPIAAHLTDKVAEETYLLGFVTISLKRVHEMFGGDNAYAFSDDTGAIYTLYRYKYYDDDDEWHIGGRVPCNIFGFLAWLRNTIGEDLQADFHEYDRLIKQGWF